MLLYNCCYTDVFENNFETKRNQEIPISHIIAKPVLLCCESEESRGNTRFQQTPHNAIFFERSFNFAFPISLDNRDEYLYVDIHIWISIWISRYGRLLVCLNCDFSFYLLRLLPDLFLVEDLPDSPFLPETLFVSLTTDRPP